MNDNEKALNYYKAGLAQNGPGPWPMPDFLPKRIRIHKTVTGDFPFGHKLIAGPGVYECQSNRFGAVHITLDNGKLLGIRPKEFEVVEWRENELNPRDI